MPARPGKKLLDTNISAKSRSQRYHSKGLWAIKAKNGGKWPAAKPKAEAKSATTVVVKETKKSGKRTVVRPRLARSIDAQSESTRSTRQRGTPRFRASIVPGRVAIVLAGDYEGRRVVVLKKLQSGLVVVVGMCSLVYCKLLILFDRLILIILGPTSLSQVPLRRISPAYLIATSLKVDLAAANVTKILEDNKAHINDGLFERESRKVKSNPPTAEQRKARAEKRAADAEGGVRKQSVVLKTPRTSNAQPLKLQHNREKKVSEKQTQKLQIQKALNYALVKEVKKTPFLKDYFRGRFELSKGQYPHNLKF
jgi:large subunit ribosomal protein L6e